METDFVLEAVVRSATASDAVGLCAKLLRQESTGLSAVTVLLERIRLGMEEEAGIRAILQGIRGACAPPAAVCDQLLQLLPLITPPTALVEALPHFVGEDPSDVSRVVTEYKELLSGDRSMLVHIVGSLHDLPLDADTRQEVSDMTLEALSIVDEEDMPVVVRTLFKTARERESAVVVSRVRAECSKLSMSTLAVLVDVMADAFSINESMARAFLADITDDLASSVGNGSRSLLDSRTPPKEVDALSTLDVVGLLLLLLHRRHVVTVHALLEKLSRKPELLPTEIVVSLAERSGESPWVCLAGPIRELGLWAAIGSPRVRFRAPGSSSNGSKSSSIVGTGGSMCGGQTVRQSSGRAFQRLRRAGARILMAVFEGQPNARGPIVSCCLAVVGTHRLPLSSSSPSAGLGLGKGGDREVAAADARLESCSGALDLLLHLCNNCSALMSPFADAVGDLVLGGTGRSLHPVLLDKAAGCLAAMARHSNAMVNELMNHVQKQVFFLMAGVGDGGFGGHFAGGHGGGGFGGGVSLQNRYGFQRGGRGVGRYGDQSARRRSAIVLATHLIRGGVLEERDADAVLGWAVRLLSLIRGGVSSLDTVAITLELLVTAAASASALHGTTQFGSGDSYDQIGSSSYGSGSSSVRERGVDDQRRQGWARAGASAAVQCLVGIGVMRMPGVRNVQSSWPRQVDEEEELVPFVVEDPSARVAILRARDIATAWWWQGRRSLSDSAQTLHRSWLAALALMSAAKPSANIHGNIETPSDWDNASNAGPISSGRGKSTPTKPGRGESYLVWVRARLSMPVWPFSQDSSRFGFGDGMTEEDASGYWGWCLGGGGQGAAFALGGVGESYELWRIPPAKCAWQGKEAVQRLVGAGSACVAARAILSATARHLLSTPDRAFSLRGSKETREDGEASYNDLVWRYLELGVRGRACVFALRRAAQELTGGRGHRSSSNSNRGVAREDEGGEVDAAAVRLEEGLNVELMPLEGLCRLVNASSESRVFPSSTSSSSSMELVAYTELLRSVTARLSGTTMMAAPPTGVGAVISRLAVGATSVTWMEGVRALDLGALFRGAVACSRALPVVRKVHAAPKAPARSESTARRSPPSGNMRSAKRSRDVNGGLGGSSGSAESTRRTRRSVGKGSGGYGGGGSRRRSLGDDEERGEGEEEEEEEEDGEKFLEGDEVASEEYTSEDYQCHETDEEEEEEEEFKFEEASKRRGKKRKLSGGRDRRGEGESGLDSCEGLPGLSLCQFWRYRLLLEVILAAKGNDEELLEDDGRVDNEETVTWEGTGDGGFGLGPRMMEVLERLSSPVADGDTGTPAAAASSVASAAAAAGDWMFSELSDQLERAEDGLLAGLIVEVLSVLSAGLGRSREAAALAWKGMGTVYPRGWGIGYSHLGGVLEGLRREGTSLLASPTSLRLFLKGSVGGAEGGRDSVSRLRGQLVFPPQLGNASLLWKVGLPSLPFLRHAFASHWALAGRMGRAWALAAAVSDIEVFLLGTSGGPQCGNAKGATKTLRVNNIKGYDQNKNSSDRGKGADAVYSSAVLCQDNFDVFLSTVVKLLPATIVLATPAAAVGVCVSSTGERHGGARGGEVAEVPGVFSSPYQEVECLGMVLECLVEACAESLKGGTWTVSSGGNEQLTALGRLLRRCVLPVVRCCSQALRALEGQMEKSLAWRCQQAPTQERGNKQGRPSVPSPLTECDISSKEDRGAPGLCRGLLEQCDLCADGARALCVAVRAVATCSAVSKREARKQREEGTGPHQIALDRVLKIIPGIVLQSDQLSTAVDNARRLLHLPRSSSLDDGDQTGDMERRSPVQRDHRRSLSRRFRRASERLSSLFVSGGGVVVTGRASGRRKNGKDKGRLSLGAELRGPWSGAEGSEKFLSQGSLHGASSTNASQQLSSAIPLPPTLLSSEGPSGFPPDRFEAETLRGRVSSGGGHPGTDNGVEEGKGQEGNVDEGILDIVVGGDDGHDDEEEVDQFRAVGGGWGLLWNQ